MAVTDKIKALLSLRGVKQTELAKHLGITPQSMRNKFARGSFSAEDLIKIADYLSCSLQFVVDEKQRIIFDLSDIRATEEKTIE